MKAFGFLKFAAVALILTTFNTACSSDSDSDNTNTNTAFVWTTDGGLKACDHILFDNNVLGNGDDEFVFTGKQTLKKGTYLLKGWVYIANGAELTIEPGTVIKGDKTSKASLIVERGGKLFAKGTATMPIVFTSAQPKGNRKPGDWGGVILCGKAVNNQGDMQIEGGPRTKHGGSDDADNSGILSYVRIEFGGYPFAANQEINGLTLGSIGSGTQLDHIQVSFSNDDSYEWFGGTVNAKYLVAYKGWDDDFDTDNGYRGKVQYGLAVRDPKIADTSLSNGFESDNWKDGTKIDPMTKAVFSNITFVGPKVMAVDFANTEAYINGGSYNPNNGSALGKYQAAMQIRRYSNLSCFNTVAIGYPVGVIIENDKGDAQGSAKAGDLKLQNTWLAGMDVTGSDKNKTWTNVALDGNGTESFSSSFFKAQPGNREVTLAEMGLAQGTYIKVNCVPLATSPLLTAAAFTDGLLSSGFDKVNYIGAFGANDNWLQGWTNFDPQNADY